MFVNLVGHVAAAILLQSTVEGSQAASIPEQDHPQPNPARAQPGQAVQASPPGAQEQSEIVVRGEKPTVDSRLDRKVYDVSKDLSRTGGSAADLLEHIPFLSVDLDGNVSIRGDSNVQVLVNGRVSAQLSGTSLGAALQQFDASRIAKIEVLTTPPASFSGSTSAGVINIILKPTVSGNSLTLASSVGSAGRFNLAPTGEMTLGFLRLHASLGLRRDVRERNARDHKTIGGEDGMPLLLLDQTRLTKSRRLGATASGGASLTLSGRDHADLDLTYSNRVDHPVYDEDDTSSPSPLAELGLPSSRSHLGRESQFNTSASITLRHDTDAKGNGVNLTASTSESRGMQDFRFVELFSGFPQTLGYLQRTNSLELARQFSLGYDGPLFGADNVSAGYELTLDRASSDQLQTIPAVRGSEALLDPRFSGALRYEQDFNAGFVSYRTSLKKWTVEGGVRVESVGTHLNPSQPVDTSRSYNLDLLPSLHIDRTVGEGGSVNLGYSRRVTRPDAASLIPYPVLQDASTVREPNTDLIPQYTDAVELGFVSGGGSKNRSYTAYFRRTNNALFLTSTVRDGITYVRLGNAGQSESVGAEAARTGRLAPSISYTLSGSVSYNRVSNARGEGDHSEVTYNAKSAATWSISKTSTLQANVTAVGRRPTPEGFLIGYRQLDLGFRQVLSKRVAATITVSDLLATHKDGYEIQESDFAESLTRQQRGRIFSVALSWTPTLKKSNASDRLGYED